jgi:hypothetical protein
VVVKQSLTAYAIHIAIFFCERATHNTVCAFFLFFTLFETTTVCCVCAPLSIAEKKDLNLISLLLFFFVVRCFVFFKECLHIDEKIFLEDKRFPIVKQYFFILEKYHAAQ